MLVKSPVAPYNVEHTVAARQRIELTIAKLVIKAALEAGYYINVGNGEEIVLKKYSQDKAEIIEHMFSTDEDSLHLFIKEPVTNKFKQVGWVQFIYGNDGYDVISDYTTNLEPLVTTANAWIEKQGH